MSIQFTRPEQFANISSLGLAIVENDLKKMETLLLSGICDPNDNTTLYTRACSPPYCGWDGFPFTSGLSSLHIAVLKANIDALEKLLAFDDIMVDSVDENGETPLFYVSYAFADLFGRKGDLVQGNLLPKFRMMNLLIDAGTNIDAVNNDGETALMKAAVKRQVEVVKFFIEKGADLTVMSKTGVPFRYFLDLPFRFWR